MNNQEGYDIINGHHVPHTYIDNDYELVGTHQGTVIVESGKFILSGKLQGTLRLNNREAEIFGKQQGSVAISSNTRVSITGLLQGSVTIAYGATVIIEPTGKMMGSLTNNGTLIVRGVFSGTQNGSGKTILEGDGNIGS